MGIPLYLAMTAAEFSNCGILPEKIAWMSCHFSPYSPGLSNFPTNLPEGSLLILDDALPISGHDPVMIKDALFRAVEQFKCSGILLDFQRPDQRELLRVIQETLALPCPVAVSSLYAEGLNCPVFLPPLPLIKTLAEYVEPWQGREIWLEADLPCATVTVTENSSTFAPRPTEEETSCPFESVQRTCQYGLEIYENKAVFTLKRAKKHINILLKEAENYQITRAIGLWQELKQ